MDLISIIIPVYQTEPYLRKCLDTVVGQTYHHLEVILVDDGSPDACGRICNEYAAGDGRIKVIHQRNAGVSAARNTGLAAASGDWIGFVDSDDYIELDMYEYLLDLAKRNNADWVQCGAFWEEPEKQKILYGAEREIRLPHGLADFDERTWRYMSNWTCTKLFRRSSLTDVRFDPIYTLGEDLQFVLRALRRASGVVFGTAPKYHYIQRQGSACNSALSKDALLSCRLMLTQAEKEFADCPVLVEFCRWEQFRTDLDICSKIVCLCTPDAGAIERELRREIRGQLPLLRKSARYSRQEKLKFFLIAWAWPIYKNNLPRLKARKRHLGGP